jgi:hypothetical protein
MALQATWQTITQCDHTPVTTSSDPCRVFVGPGAPSVFVRRVQIIQIWAHEDRLVRSVLVREIRVRSTASASKIVKENARTGLPPDAFYGMLVAPATPAAPASVGRVATRGTAHSDRLDATPSRQRYAGPLEAAERPELTRMDYLRAQVACHAAKRRGDAVPAAAAAGVLLRGDLPRRPACAAPPCVRQAAVAANACTWWPPPLAPSCPAPSPSGAAARASLAPARYGTCPPPRRWRRVSGLVIGDLIRA